jgi:hypothetical protein
MSFAHVEQLVGAAARVRGSTDNGEQTTRKSRCTVELADGWHVRFNGPAERTASYLPLAGRTESGSLGCAGVGDENPFGGIVQREALGDRWVEVASASNYYYSKGAPHLWPSQFESLPKSRVWEYNNAESLVELGLGQDVEGTAEAFTKTVFKDVKAFAFMQLLKTGHLLDGAVALLNLENVLGASTCARSALESTAAMTDVVSRAQSAIRDHAGEPKETSEALAEVSDYVVKCLWGGRATGRPVQSVNVTTQLNRLVRLTTDEHSKDLLLAVHEQLCDVVHPSATGHQTFWSPPTRFGEKGPWLVELNAERVNATAVGVAELILWAIGWSAAWSVRSWENTGLPGESP